MGDCNHEWRLTTIGGKTVMICEKCRKVADPEQV